MQTILFFDIDLTLVHNQFSWTVLRKPMEELLAASGKSVDELAQELAAENSLRQQTDPDNILTMDWQDIVQQMAQKYGVTLSNSVDKLWLDYAETDGVEVLDNAPQVLQQLKADHRQLVIATKGLSKYQDPVLAAAKLTHYFDDILAPDKTGYLKTSPAYFDKYRNHEALFIQIGDHYYDDVMCAKRNGFYSVMRAPIDALAAYDPFERPNRLEQHANEIHTYPSAGTDIRPDAVVLSLAEVPDVIARIESQQSD